MCSVRPPTSPTPVLTLPPLPLPEPPNTTGAADTEDLVPGSRRPLQVCPQAVSPASWGQSQQSESHGGEVMTRAAPRATSLTRPRSPVISM